MKLIKLTQGKFAKVDDEDFERLNKYKWCVLKGRHTFYAARHLPGKLSPDRRRKTIRMHRVVMNAPPGIECDHVDGIGTNNQKSNLRIATTQENRRNQIKAMSNNKLGIKGVHWDRRKKKFMTQIQVGGKKIHLGRFFCLERAKRVYRDAELKYFGKFARKQTGKATKEIK